MDNKFDKRQIKKLKMHPFGVFITRHKEYDFGSYKRAFLYAKGKDVLQNYEFVYLVNDSVFGPMTNLSKLIHKMERIPKDAVGLVTSKHKTHCFMESWFVRLNKKIFLSSWFDDFITSVKKQPNKSEITIKYEHGLTKLIEQHRCSWTGILDVNGRATYNKPKYLFDNGCPFIKKSSFTRHCGAAGKQVKYIFEHSDENAVKSVMKTANRLYGEKHMKYFLTSNSIKILWRNILYVLKKLISRKK
jgi:lipopolysaccharide biosynthesis protein